MAAVQQQTTQLEFHQAMADFKVMFPEMDHDVIEAVLRANQGAVDATIDQLLAMSTDNENERLRNEMEKKEKQQWTSPQPSSAAAPLPSASALTSIKATPSQSSHSSQSRQTSSPLLSLPQSQQHSTPSAGGPAPISNTPIPSSHSPSRRIQGAASTTMPAGNSVSPSKTKEVVTQQLIPSPVASATSSPRKAEEREAHGRSGPNGESSSDREDGAQMIELDGDADQKDDDEQIPLRVIHGWEPPLLGQLPDDFLRITVPSVSAHWTPTSKKPQV